MKNNYLLTLLFFLLPLGVAHAEWNVEKGKAYYITCNYANGWLGLGLYQSSGYPLIYQTSGAEKSDDAWWLISPDGDGYTIQNNYTGEYLTWSDDYDQLRNLDLSKYVTDDRQRWTLEEADDGIVIRSLYNPGYHLNTRTGTTHYVALYSGNVSTNSIFKIWDQDGNQVTDRVAVQSITLSGRTTMAVGEEQQIAISVQPEDADQSAITWASSNSKVVAVDASGRAQALRAGTAVVTAKDKGVTGSLTITVTDDTYMAHGKDMLYLRHFDSTMTVIPKDYVSQHELTKKRFTATLVNGEKVSLGNIMEVTETTPKDVPAFSSYKFNNKYNPQVFTDAIAANPSTDAIALSVAGIGKWLTASFQTADEYTRVWVDDVRQKSKRTRQSFAQPVTYQLTNPKWQTIRLRKQNDGSYKQETGDFVREQTVSVTFTTDNSTNDYIVPRIDITLLDAEGGSPTGEWSYTNWIGMYGKTTYMPALVEIQGGGVFPDFPSTPVLVKGRGNSTWRDNYLSKNPYRLKFAVKQKPLGMTAGKNWVLLSNKLSGSMTTNAIGMRLANMFGAAGANHIVPVELYVNGSYRGSYNLTEKVGFSNNSIDLVDESLAAMIEMDNNPEEDGSTGNTTNTYGLNCKIHEPDLDDEYFDAGGLLSRTDIFHDYYNMMSVLRRGGDDYTNLVDVDYLVRYLSTNETIDNLELAHPKSVFAYSEDVMNLVSDGEQDPTPWIFGPVWDCDWAFGYEGTRSYFVENADRDYFETIKAFSLSSEDRTNLFWDHLRYNSDKVKEAYYRLWTDVMINGGGIQELKDFCEEYYEFAQESLEHNRESEAYEYDGNDYRVITDNSKTWLDRRINHIYNSLEAYPLTPDEDQDEDYAGILGDVNSDGSVSAADLVSLLNHLGGQENETFVKGRADVDGNGSVTSADEDPLLALVWNQAVNANRNNHLPMATISLRPVPFATTPKSEAALMVKLVADEGKYSALQMDVQLPLGVEMNGITLPSDMAGMTARSHMLADGLYRVVIYADGRQVLPQTVTEVGLRLVTAGQMEEAVIFQNITCATSLGEEERLASTACRFVVNESGTDGLRQPAAGSAAGKRTTLYDLSGRAVRPGQSHRGVYIQNGRKYVK